MATPQRNLNHVKYVARKHWKAYREAHHWEADGHILNARRMAHIRDWTGQQVVDGNEELRIPGHYELGHKFILEHSIASIKSDPVFTQSDYERVRSLMGKVYYRVPAEERLKMRDAALALVQKHKNHQQLFDHLRDQLRYLNQQIAHMPPSPHMEGDYIGKASTQTDIFVNTAGNPIARLIINEKSGIKNFYDLAKKTRRNGWVKGAA